MKAIRGDFGGGGRALRLLVPTIDEPPRVIVGRIWRLSCPAFRQSFQILWVYQPLLQVSRMRCVCVVRTALPSYTPITPEVIVNYFVNFNDSLIEQYRTVNYIVVVE